MTEEVKQITSSEELYVEALAAHHKFAAAREEAESLARARAKAFRKFNSSLKPKDPLRTKFIEETGLYPGNFSNIVRYSYKTD